MTKAKETKDENITTLEAIALVDKSEQTMILGSDASIDIIVNDIAFKCTNTSFLIILS